MSEQPAETGGDGPVLVPVGQSVTMRQTVAYAVDVALETDDPTVHFVLPVAWHDVGDVSADVRREVADRLERAGVWAEEDAGEAELTVETAVVGDDEYLFSPDDYARVLAAYADAHGVGRIVVDPQYSPGGNVPLLAPMEADLERRGYAVEEAPVETPVRRRRLAARGSAKTFGLLFGVSFVFYHLLGGFTVVTGDAYDLYYELLTGTVTAGLVAGALHRVSLEREPSVTGLAVQTVRMTLYVPYLLYEILVSNLVVTYIVLHPRLPIDPRLTRMRAAVWGGVPLTTLANSITLTPGTLTVRADGQDLYVHSLFAGAREGLFEGGLERGVRFVFYGREAAAIASPAERGVCEVLQADEGDDDKDDGAEGDDEADATGGGEGPAR